LTRLVARENFIISLVLTDTNPILRILLECIRNVFLLNLCLPSR